MSGLGAAMGDAIAPLLRIGLDLAVATTARREAGVSIAQRLIFAGLALAAGVVAFACLNAGAFALLEPRITPGGAWLAIAAIDGLTGGLCFYLAAKKR